MSWFWLWAGTTHFAASLSRPVVRISTRFSREPAPRIPSVKLVVAGMLIPPNWGREYFNGFRALFPELAKKHQAGLIPFLLEGVGGKPELNFPDGIHPNCRGPSNSRCAMFGRCLNQCYGQCRDSDPKLATESAKKGLLGMTSQQGFAVPQTP